MCGIIGVVGKREAEPLLLNGLKRLEYRGYDSAGIALVTDEHFARARAEGKLVKLAEQLKLNPLQGTTGIGHTRWATHGLPNERNAHPHATEEVAVVHNGIIENYQELRERLSKSGASFASDTDTEVIPQLITYYLRQGQSPEEAVAAALPELEGAFAIGVVFARHPNLLIAARRGSPLAIGYGDGEMFIGSDAVALAPLTKQICYLEEGDWAVLSKEGAQIYNAQNQPVKRAVKASALQDEAIVKGNFDHYMHKEIYDQPTVIGQTLNMHYHAGEIRMPELPFNLADIRHINLTACGTSYYAALVARYWLESLARVHVTIDIASEFRYREPLLEQGGLTIGISQSGETADTLAALHYAKQQNQATLAIVNVPESSMTKMADAVLQTAAGPEIGVASTKAFTTQLTTLACFTLALAQAQGHLSEENVRSLSHHLAEVPAKITEILHHEDAIAALAKDIAEARDMLYIGRGTSYAIAYEAALKMKEISYIHAEAYAAGEMKHGPIALIDEHMPVIAIAPNDKWLDKTISNIREAAARGGKIILFTDEHAAKKLEDVAWRTLRLPSVDPFVSPLLYVVPAQLLAYHVALIKGTDVDQPRNLAKSVTVE